jgi:hypothetical protein
VGGDGAREAVDVGVLVVRQDDHGEVGREISDEAGGCPAPAAAVRDGLDVVLDAPPAAVAGVVGVDGRAVVEGPVGPRGVERRLVEDRSVPEGAVPQDHVIEAGEDVAIALDDRGLLDVLAFLVPLGPVGDDEREIVERARAAHAQLLEDVGLDEARIRQAAHLLDEAGEQRVAAVVVLVLLAGRALGRGAVQPLDVGLAGQLGELLVGAIPVVARVVGQPRGVPEQVADEHGAALRFDLVGGEPVGDLVLERELAARREEQHAGRGELLRHRREIEDRTGRDGGLAVDVRQAVPLQVHDLPLVYDEDGRAGPVLLEFLFDDLVYLVDAGLSCHRGNLPNRAHRVERVRSSCRERPGSRGADTKAYEQPIPRRALANGTALFVARAPRGSMALAPSQLVATN